MQLRTASAIAIACLSIGGLLNLTHTIASAISMHHWYLSMGIKKPGLSLFWSTIASVVGLLLFHGPFILFFVVFYRNQPKNALSGQMLDLCNDAQQIVGRDRPIASKRKNMMDVYLARSKFGQAISILASHPGRIEERLRSAYDNAISCVHGTDIPSELAERYESMMRSFSWIRDGSSPPSENDLQSLATVIEDMYALLDSSLSPSE